MPLTFFLKTLRNRKPITLSPSITNFISTRSEVHQTPKDPNFTVSHLIESFGLTLTAAKHWSTKLNTKSSNNPTEVLKFFKEHGFSDTQIARIVRIRPQVLFTDPDRYLKPKVEVFGLFGASKDVVARIVEKCPVILCSSVENRLLPSLNSLRGLVKEDENGVGMMLRWHNLFLFQLQDTLSPNVATLREFGVSEKVVSKTLSHRTHGLLCPSDRFRKAVEKVNGLGFDVKKFSFVEAVIAITNLKDYQWDRRCNAFRKWGWSDADLVSAFLKHPLYMGCAEKKIDEIMDFMVNYMGFKPSFIAECPWIFKYSRERIVPRYSVFMTLLAKGVITKDDWKLGSVVIFTEPLFIEKFIKKHETVLPELLGLYTQSKKDAIPF